MPPQSQRAGVAAADWKQGVPVTSSIGLVTEQGTEGTTRGKSDAVFLIFQYLFRLFSYCCLRSTVNETCPLLPHITHPHSSLHDRSSVSGLWQGRKGLGFQDSRGYGYQGLGNPQAGHFVTVSCWQSYLS